jgi:hypothetical protein
MFRLFRSSARIPKDNVYYVDYITFTLVPLAILCAGLWLTQRVLTNKVDFPQLLPQAVVYEA